MGIVIKIIASMAAMFLCVNAGAAEKMKQPTVEYSADMVMGSEQGSSTGKVFYALGGKSRTEFNTQGTTAITILRQDKKVAWVLMPEQKTYMEMGIDESKENAGQDLSDCDVDFSSLGQETVNGIKATKNKTSVTCPDNVKYDGTMWISKDNIVVKMDTATVVDGNQVNMKYELKNLKIEKQDASLFEIPAGYQKFSMGNFSSMFNAAQGQASQARSEAAEEEDEYDDYDESSETQEDINPVEEVDSAADKANDTMDTTDKVKNTVDRLKGLFGR
ncbi:MAG: DUF4412 domain-containing protein [Deltaproteobacteria bacterium]|nr:DUF4412 domain-containing protein [Deltaproteobacteria bacterium]